MSLATTAILASAIRPSSSSTPAAKPTGIVESISQKPLQWLVVTGAVIYFGGKFIKNVIPTGDNIRKGEAETTTSTDNPWSANTFMAQKIPVNTNLLTANDYCITSKVSENGQQNNPIFEVKVTSEDAEDKLTSTGEQKVLSTI